VKDDLSHVLAGKGDLVSIAWGLSWGFDGFEIEEPFS
jgi:queuine tRNA-ribosyltransferase subunit QTRTD1